MIREQEAAFHTPLVVADLLSMKEESLALELLTNRVPLDRLILDPDVSSPGLALAGFTERFATGRMQVFGETEMTYLRTLDDEERTTRLRDFFTQEIPAAFITKGQDVPAPFLEMAEEGGVPVIRSYLTTKEFFRRIKPFLEVSLAPSTTLHGSLADIYGVGVLFMGKSGIGKSECVLDLVERGHRLVADDMVLVSRRGNDLLIGRGHELQRHHMEIRGVGIIDVRALFGVRATRQQKRIELVVQLEEWDTEHSYERTGLDGTEAEILGVRVPQVTIPLNPGKNITVISEVVAMNHLLKYSGIDSARAFDQAIRDAMRPVREYLEEDYE